MAALEQFETAEANLVKLERLWKELEKLMPGGVSFGSNAEYEDRSRSYTSILNALPSIDGWKPEASAPDLDELAQSRFDAMELGELSAHVSVERWAEEPGRELREYRFRLNSKRRELIREALVQLIDAIDANIRDLRVLAAGAQSNKKLSEDAWKDFRDHVGQIEVLLGSSVARPARWGDLRRHMSFGMVGDLDDIERLDWPQAKASLSPAGVSSQC
ncbi:MAG: hypothetical protein K2P70_08070 [Hyphomonadaceae bacterium]|nr:hypothetical protein [Hyphomonadaceae bacterium]